MKDVTVWAIRTDTVRQLDLSGLESAMPKRTEKAGRFLFERDRLLCLGAGYLMMKGAGIRNEAELRYGANGKPYAPGYTEFNISHSGEWCVLACGDLNTVGIDIEEMNLKHTEVAPAVYTRRELDWMAVDPTDRFFRLWTWKESLMKAAGLGMSLEPRSFEVLPFAEGKPVLLRGSAWYAAGGSLEGYRYSVCSDVPIGRVLWTEMGLE